MTRIHIWRHGQTDYNAALRVQGSIDIPLNERGLAQAERGAAALGSMKIRKIVTSDLSRAYVTAKALAAVTGVELVVEPLLRERNYGQWEGLTHDEIHAQYPEQFAHWVARTDPEGVGVESRAALGERFITALAKHVLEPGMTDVAMVCHGGIATAGILALTGHEPATSTWLGPLDNCHWSTMQLRSGGEWRLNAHNVGPV